MENVENIIELLVEVKDSISNLDQDKLIEKIEEKDLTVLANADNVLSKLISELLQL